jgi:hypothetical protein
VFQNLLELEVNAAVQLSFICISDAAVLSPAQHPAAA